jgi:hypothetical protein
LSIVITAIHPRPAGPSRSRAENQFPLDRSW